MEVNNKRTNIDVACELLQGEKVSETRVDIPCVSTNKNVKKTAYITFKKVLTEDEFKDNNLYWMYATNLTVNVECDTQNRAWCEYRERILRGKIWKKIYADLNKRRTWIGFKSIREYDKFNKDERNFRNC